MAASAIRESAGAVLLDLVVTPNASLSEVLGPDPWRKALRVRVAAKAAGGAANEELVRFLADALGLPRSSVRIVSGATSRRKTVAVVGRTRGEIAARLGGGA